MIDLEILYHDAYILAINKPVGLMVEPDRHGNTNVVDVVRPIMGRHLKLKTGPGVCYRLDRAVSGVLVLAQTPLALKGLNKQIEDRGVKKRYRAQVEGLIEGASGEWNHFLKRSVDRKKAELADAGDRAGQKARLEWKAIRQFEDRSELQITLHTGRFHQIRAQASLEGHPVCNDVHYGAKPISGIEGIALHAESYGFRHPKSGEWLEISADPKPGVFKL